MKERDANRTRALVKMTQRRRCSIVKMAHFTRKKKWTYGNYNNAKSNMRSGIYIQPAHILNVKVCLYRTRSNQNVTSLKTCKRFQPVAIFARGCLISLGQNCWWMVGLFWAKIRERPLAKVANLRVLCRGTLNRSWASSIIKRRGKYVFIQLGNARLAYGQDHRVLLIRRPSGKSP